MKEPTEEELNMLSKGLITGQELDSLEKKKVSLTREIDKLEQTISSLNDVVSNHEGMKKKYSNVLEEVQSITETRDALRLEVDRLNLVIAEKDALMLEVAKYKKMVKVLQDEMQEFEDNFESRKEKAELSFMSAKDRLNSLHKDIGNVIEQIQ